MSGTKDTVIVKADTVSTLEEFAVKYQKTTSNCIKGLKLDTFVNILQEDWACEYTDEYFSSFVCESPGGLIKMQLLIQ